MSAHEKAKTQSIHPLLAVILKEYFGYNSEKKLNKEEAISIALKIASDTMMLLDAMGELHYDQVQKLGECEFPEEDTVQCGIQSAKSKLRVIKEIIIYAVCSTESEYAVLNEYEKACEQERHSETATSTANA